MTRVLIVDDMPEVRRMLRSRLQRRYELAGDLFDGFSPASQALSATSSSGWLRIATGLFTAEGSPRPPCDEVLRPRR